ncbi:Wound-responsive family protein [Trema orientale]|uniref:Wound-responsive family protein n=1 Tax=Trema orientale TaxID=63057 RepID=A0A2P5F3N0_TREOI|nr:Wound-responsive family protein [Trema orientale]
MGSASRSAWIVAASIGAVEALKDQMGVCRWNFVLRSVQNHAKTNIRSFSQAKKLTARSSVAVTKMREESLKQSEKSMRRVMYLNCWGS